MGMLQVVIMDESHKVHTGLGFGGSGGAKKKGSAPLSVRAAIEVARSARRVIMLSGTPCVSKPLNLFAQVDCLRPGACACGVCGVVCRGVWWRVIEGIAVGSQSRCS